MNGTQFRKIRETLKLTQEEIAVPLCLSGKKAVSNIERDVRKPGPLIAALMQVFADLPERRSKEIRELLTSVRNRQKGS